MKLYKILHAIFLIVMMISCSQETVINKSITEKLNAPDTKMCIDIVTEKSRTVRPEIAKWQIDIELLTPSDAVKSEDNSETLRFSRIIGGRITSTTFINVTTGNYKISVSGKTENDVTILSGKNDNFPVDTYEINTCTIEMKDTFDNNSKSTDGKGHLDVTISGLNGLFTDGEDFILTYRKLSESDNGTRITLNYENGTLTGESEKPIPAGSYKIDITHDDETKTKVNLVKDPVVNIYPDATTDINWEWSYDSDKINADHDLKDLKIPVWNKNADRNNNVGYIGADALFAYPDMTDETFVACDTDDADDMWVLTITDTTEETTDEATTVTNTYKLKNLNTNNEYYFTSENTIEDFTIAEIDLNPFLYPAREMYEPEEEYQTAISDYEKIMTTLNTQFNTTGTKFKFLFVLSSNDTEENNNQIYTCFIDSLAKEKVDSNKVTLVLNGESVFSPYITQYELSDFSSKNLSAIELAYENSSGLYLYVAETCPAANGNNITNLEHFNYYQNIYKIKIIDISEELIGSDNEGNPTVISPKFYCSYIRDDSQSGLIPILTLDISKSFNSNKGENEFKFCNEAFKISDIYIKENGGEYNLYATVGCVSYNPVASNHKYFSYSLGGLFKFDNVSAFSSEKDEYGFENWNFSTTENLTYVGGLNENLGISDNIKWKILNAEGEPIFNTLIGLTQAETDDSEYFAGPRCIIPSGNRLFIIDSGFYGEYETVTNSQTPAITKTVNFNLEDKRNRIFTFDTTSETLSLTKVDDSISFDYDYITETKWTKTDEDGNIIPVSW